MYIQGHMKQFETCLILLECVLRQQIMEGKQKKKKKQKNKKTGDKTRDFQETADQQTEEETV